MSNELLTPRRSLLSGTVPGVPTRNGVSRFVGRDAELRELVACLTRPATRGAVVAGPEGCGSTRLVTEALATVDPPSGWVDGVEAIATGVRGSAADRGDRVDRGRTRTRAAPWLV